MPPILTCYAPVYAATTPVASMRKPPVVAEHLSRHHLATLIDPTPGCDPIPLLRRLHEPSYVHAVLTGGVGGDAAFGIWSPAIRDGVLAMQAGQLHAAQLALAGAPIVGNIAQGFHHARPRRGKGYCTFNGLALVALAHPDRTIAVMDVDEHEGDGTSVFAQDLPNLRNATVFGSPMGGPRHPRVHAVNLDGSALLPATYLDAVATACTWLADQRPDLVLYNAGMDCHVDDPLGTLRLTTDTIRARDRLVFRFWRQQSVPVVFCLAGGYQTPLEQLAALHAITWEEGMAAHGE